MVVGGGQGWYCTTMALGMTCNSWQMRMRGRRDWRILNSPTDVAGFEMGGRSTFNVQHSTILEPVEGCRRLIVYCNDTYFLSSSIYLPYPYTIRFFCKIFIRDRCYSHSRPEYKDHSTSARFFCSLFFHSRASRPSLPSPRMQRPLPDIPAPTPMTPSLDLRARGLCAGPPASLAVSSSCFSSGQLSACWWRCLIFSTFSGTFPPSSSLSSTFVHGCIENTLILPESTGTRTSITSRSTRGSRSAFSGMRW
ncbi:hypothetical protein BJV78DRAFT_4233 [Lactifluus subvellereus]|nr:hypothetical protein BJV78DRAFT_4233 [Lactifluus subvellereus]